MDSAPRPSGCIAICSAVPSDCGSTRKVGGIGRSWQPLDWTYRVGARFIKPGIYTPDTDFNAASPESARC